LVDLIRECRTPDLFFLSTPVLTPRIPFCVLFWNPTCAVLSAFDFSSLSLSRRRATFS
jgi:hypothetical protein